MPQPGPALLPVVHFAPFDLDLRTGELSKEGARIRLQEHPFAILRRLLQCPGDVVTGDELRASLWPNDTVADFEHGLNTAMRRLREALGDDADRPRFVETVAPHGYRFIAPVQTVSAGLQPGQPELRLVPPADPGKDCGASCCDSSTARPWPSAPRS